MEHDTTTDLPADAHARSATDRCGHCGGALRPDAPWCTLCLTPTAPEPGPVPPPVPGPGRAPEAFDPLTAPLELLLAAAHPRPASGTPIPAPVPAASAPAWPCAACSAPNPLEATACGACGSGFLEQVRRSEEPLLVLPLIGDVSRLDKLQSLVLATAVVVALLLVTLLAGVLLG